MNFHSGPLGIGALPLPLEQLRGARQKVHPAVGVDGDRSAFLGPIPSNLLATVAAQAHRTKHAARPLLAPNPGDAKRRSADHVTPVIEAPSVRGSDSPYRLLARQTGPEYP